MCGTIMLIPVYGAENTQRECTINFFEKTLLIAEFLCVMKF